jgi:hypothetical protein
MMRLAAAVPLAVLVTFPLAILPSPPVTWLVATALLVAGPGVLALSVPLVAAGASLVLIGYALALVIARPAADPLGALAVGATLVLLLALVHFAGTVQGAALEAGVVATQVRQWLGVVAAGVVAAAVLTSGATALAPALAGATLPLVVAAAALGALLAAAGLIALLSGS